MLQPDVNVRQVHVPPDHLQCGVPQDALERERVPAVDEIVYGKGVAEKVPMV
jgi:hypothetical protein